MYSLWQLKDFGKQGKTGVTTVTLALLETIQHPAGAATTAVLVTRIVSYKKKNKSKYHRGITPVRQSVHPTVRPSNYDTRSLHVTMYCTSGRPIKLLYDNFSN